MYKVSSLLLVAGLLLSASAAHAWSYGVAGTTQRPGDSGNGCATCHGASPSVVDVQLQGANAILPGGSARYSVMIDNIGNATARGGFTVAVTKLPGSQPVFANVPGEPTATTDSSTQIVNNNTSLPLRLPSGGKVTYLVDLSVPASIAMGSEYTLYAVGDAGHGTNQVGWNFAAPFTITIAPPVPESLAADQDNASTSEIALTWTGSGQGEHFRVLRKTAAYPDSATDPAADLVYEGPDSQATATGLAAGTRYYLAVYGKAPGEAYYSSDAARVIAASRPVAPGALILDPVSGSELILEWSGSSAEYRLLRRVGEPPTAPDDASADLIYEGSATTVADGGLSSEPTYHYRLWSKVPETAVFSAESSQAQWRDLLHFDRFELAP